MVRKSVKLFGEWSKPCGVAPLVEFFHAFSSLWCVFTGYQGFILSQGEGCREDARGMAANT